MKDVEETRKSILVRGTVQGVGFRPFVYRLARRHGLRGWVGNRSSDVQIIVQGTADAIMVFLDDLKCKAPSHARIESIAVSHANNERYGDFEIRSSYFSTLISQPIPPDLATCNDCLQELLDPHDRRYRYPFINCTTCGPRFTIIDGVPYDRERTTMSRFQMCPACQTEYDDPLNRRFHAQPNACADCGPRVTLRDASGAAYANGAYASAAHECNDSVFETAKLLATGAIVAIKGIGGFHLAVDAGDENAVQRLRQRKQRDERPLALMAADLDTVREICHTNPLEEELLTQSQRPIVLIRAKRRCGLHVAPSVAPGHHDLGVMLPYSPLHHLLLRDMMDLGKMPLLVMTSGNLADEPIAFHNDDALNRLESIADFFLTHDRPIRTRCDDSVVRCVDNRATSIRRSRGYSPQPIAVSFEFPESILACGAHLKNTFCFGRDHHAVLSHHIGDLDNYQALQSFSDGIRHFKELFDFQPTVIAHDLHPEYSSTRYAYELDDVRLMGVQHHHAHIASVIAEHRLSGPVIGVAMDGTGMGLDDRVWGGEFLIGDSKDFTRAAHLEYVAMPGGEQAVRQPWRMAVSYLYGVFGEQFFELDLPLVQKLDRNECVVLQRMIDRNVNCPLTSSMGRLFDAVASIATGRQTVSYEGQAAIELEMLADPNIDDAYEFHFTAASAIDPNPVIHDVVGDVRRGQSAAVISARFHHAVANMIGRVCGKLRVESKIHQVALSGGVFQNALLLEKTISRLRSEGFDVYTNNQVPVNDGGISLGQAAVAAARLGAEVDADD